MFSRESIYRSSFPCTHTGKQTDVPNAGTREGAAGGVKPTLSLSKGGRAQKFHNASRYSRVRQSLHRAGFCSSFHSKSLYMKARENGTETAGK